MIKIESDTFNIDSVMALLGGVETNFVLAGTWNKIPWRMWLNEPSDTLAISQWILELGDHRYPLAQSSQWEQSESSKTWRQSKSTWRLKTRDGRWVPSLQSIDDLTID